MKQFPSLFAISLFSTLMLSSPASAQECAFEPSRREVVLETTSGNIRIALFNETPIHRDNFIKLVRNGYYDGTLFHRVIRDFMIQGGADDSRDAQEGEVCGETDTGYTLPAEFRLPKLFHKRGMVAAAREPDESNPAKASSGAQFYIVWGRKQSKRELQRQRERLDTLDGGRTPMTDEMARFYSEIGGTPHLDGAYTIFGEVVEGMDVVDRIQRQATDEHDRPVTDERLMRAYVVEVTTQQAHLP